MKKILLILSIVFLCAILVAGMLKKPSDNRVKIQFSSWGSQSETALLKPLIAEFEKENPQIKIEFIHIPQNYFQKIHLLFASNLAPDVIFINNYYAPKYVKAGLLEDLTPHIKKEEYFDKALQGFTFDDKIYAIPRDVSNLVVYYNKDLFKQYNVAYPDKNWTINDYISIAEKLTQDTYKDGKTDIWGTSFETDIFYIFPYLYSNGASVLSNDGKDFVLDKNALDTIDLYSSIANKHNAAPKKSQSASLTMAQMFLQEKIAMHLSGRWLVPKYRQDAKFDWDIAPFPKGSEGSIVNIDASGYALSKSSKHKKEALKFIEFISGNKPLETLSKSGLIVPARKDTAFGKTFLDKTQRPQNAQVFIDTIETGKSTPVNENYQKITDRLNVLLEPVFLGKKKAHEVLKTD